MSAMVKDDRLGPGARPGTVRPGQRHRHLDGGQRRPGVPLAGGHHGVDGVLVGRGALRLEAAPDQGAQVLGAERAAVATGRSGSTGAG